MTANRQIKAVLFDMDGVLIEAKDWHYESLNKALDLFGMSISRFDHLTMFDGLPTRRKLDMLSMERGLPRELHEFLNKMKQQYTMDIVHTSCKPRFCHQQALATLKHQGYHIAVCSNSVRLTVETMMEKAGLRHFIDYMVSNEDVKTGKPDPEMYLKAMEKFGIRPNECLIVEDNEHGIRAARAAGAHLLVVREVTDTHIENILSRIREVENGINRSAA